MSNFTKENINKETFCLAPFVSLYIGTDQEVKACCFNKSSYGSGESKEQIIQSYNSEEMKLLRSNLINGVQDKSCRDCWHSEKLSKKSYRHGTNDKFDHFMDAVLDNINPDYSVKEIKFRRLDIRFSNVCNLKCRSCSAKASSMWVSDEIKLGWKSPETIKIRNPTTKSNLEYISGQLPNVEEIYFAGGEPLIMDEHYALLDKILELGLQDKISITYNTNFSKLNHKGKDVTEYWNKFKSVTVGASLDGSYERGEYIRSNLVWADVVENKKYLMEKAPNVNFYIAATLSIMNAYNILDLHKEWVDLGLIGRDSLHVSLLYHPQTYRLSNLPEHHKEKLRHLYQEHLDWLNTPLPNNPHVHERSKNGFRAAINLLNEPADPDWPNMWKKNNSIDVIRDENFFDVFTEYADLREMLS